MGRLASACWYTNLDHNKRHEELILYKRYYGNEEDYPKYDNYDAINVDKVSDIPCDYFEDMGVPITSLDKYNPGQFEVVKFRKGNDEKDLTYTVAGATVLTDRQTDRQTQNRALLQDYHQAQDVTASSESQLHSLTSTAQTNSRSSEQLKARGKDSQTAYGMQTAELHNRLFLVREDTNGYLSGARCNGVMGVPITFLDKYSPKQFDIVGLAAGNIRGLAGIPSRTGKDGPYIGGKLRYGRVFIKRKRRNAHED